MIKLTNNLLWRRFCLCVVFLVCCVVYQQNRGSGSELDNIKKLANELKTDNVIFYGQRPLEEMPDLYKIADVMLVTLEDKSYANMTIPGKVQSYIAVGKPIIGSVNGRCANILLIMK